MIKKILKNATIYTVEGADWEHHPVQAMAVTEDGKIRAAGSEAEILKLAEDVTEIIDLEGRTVLPGFIDSHTHVPGKSLIQSIMQLNENTAIPLRSMLMYYYVQTVCSGWSLKKSVKVMDHLLDLIGGRDHLRDSRSSDYDGVNRFNNAECRYFLGFTESMKYFKRDNYIVSFPRFADEHKDEKKMFMVDFVSLGKDIPDDKLQDCVDLVKIMVDEQYIYDVCTLDGQL